MLNIMIKESDIYNATLTEAAEVRVRKYAEDQKCTLDEAIIQMITNEYVYETAYQDDENTPYDESTMLYLDKATQWKNCDGHMVESVNLSPLNSWDDKQYNL